MSDNLIKKAEKLASAIYLVTSFFPEQEPLKWRLRTLSADLASLALGIRDTFRSDQKGSSLQARQVVKEICSYLAIAQNSGLISGVNGDILSQEINKYLDMFSLPPEISDVDNQLVISNKYFDVPIELSARAGGVEDEHIKDKTTEVSDYVPEFKVLKDIQGNSPYGSYLQRGDKNPPSQLRKKASNLNEFGAVSVKKNGRKSIIIGLLKRRKEIMIKDVSPLISGCSEKTIQRELLGLVKEGVLKKEGEKRWSKYSLA